MEKLRTGDYIIRMPQVKELLDKCLIGNKMFNEELNSVEEIIGVQYTYRRRNIGSFFKPVYEEVKIVEGIIINCETKSTVRRGTYYFEPGKGEEWIEKTIPRRVKLLEKILNQIEYMKIK